MKGSTAKIAKNAMSLLAGDIFNKASTFCIYALLGRYAGTHGFGQIALGLALLYLFNVFAAGGLPVLITRRVAQNKKRSKYFLRNGYFAATVTAIASTLAMIVFTRIMNYEATTVSVITILAVSIIPFALTMIAEAVVRGREEMHLVALANIPGNGLMVLLGAYVLFNDHGVITLAWVIAISRLVTFLTINLLLGFSLRQDNIPAARVSVGVCRKLLSSSMVFLGSDGINALWHSMDAMILSTYATEADIGLLQSSFQLLQPALMVYRSVGHSSFPALVEAARVGPEKIAEISNSLIGYLLRLSIPAAIAMFVLSEDLLVTVYGNEEFRAGGIVLKILSVTLILDLINPVLGHGLWAASRDKSVLKIVICNLVVSCLVAFFLIRSFGLVGAACSVLTSTVVNVIQHNWYFQREVVRMPLWKEALKVVPAASVLVVCVALLPTHRFVSLGIGIVAYVVINLLRFPESWRRASQPNAVAS